jgi:hypothetical protein
MNRPVAEFAPERIIRMAASNGSMKMNASNRCGET